MSAEEAACAAGSSHLRLRSLAEAVAALLRVQLRGEVHLQRAVASPRQSATNARVCVRAPQQTSVAKVLLLGF